MCVRAQTIQAARCGPGNGWLVQWFRVILLRGTPSAAAVVLLVYGRARLCFFGRSAGCCASVLIARYWRCGNHVQSLYSAYSLVSQRCRAAMSARVLVLLHCVPPLECTAVLPYRRVYKTLGRAYVALRTWTGFWFFKVTGVWLLCTVTGFLMYLFLKQIHSWSDLN